MSDPDSANFVIVHPCVEAPLRTIPFLMANSPKHSTPEHRAARAAILPAARADPNTRCWRCGQTMIDRRQTHPRAIWHTGHLPAGGWAAECSPCNTADGARTRNARSASIFDW